MAARCLLAALALAGCSTTTLPPPPPSLTVVLPSEVLTLKPNEDLEVFTNSVLDNVYEPLVGFDSQLRLRTVLAESWEHPEPQRWRFRLRAGVRFHDGTPLTAEAVRSALQRLREAPEEEASSFVEEVREVVVVDERTLEIVTHEPRALLSNLPFFSVSRPNAAGGFPPVVGTGPYRIREATAGRVRLERFAGYWGRPPLFARADFVPVPDAAARVQRVADGSADLAYQVSAATRQPLVQLVQRAGMAVFYLVPDLRPRPGNPLADLRVRQALHLAIDRPALVRVGLHGAGQVATQPIAPLVFGFDPEQAAPVLDAERARRLLQEAGYARGFSLPLDFNDARLSTARLVKEQLAQVGVTLELRPLPSERLWKHAKASRGALTLMGWGCSTGEAGEFYDFCLRTPRPGRGQGNLGGYSNPRVDEIADSHAAVLERRERQALFQEASAIVMRELPVLPLYVEDEVYAARPGLRVEPRADGVILLEDVKPDK